MIIVTLIRYPMTTKLLGVIYWSGGMIFLDYINHGLFFLNYPSDKDFTFEVTLDLIYAYRLSTGQRQCPYQIK
jgi:hypothetical protein